MRLYPANGTLQFRFVFLNPFAYGDDGIRTHDPLLAGQVLSQLSYTPVASRRTRSSSFFQFSLMNSPDLGVRPLCGSVRTSLSLNELFSSFTEN